MKLYMGEEIVQSYDGDQMTFKIVFSQEANRECDRVMNSKSFFINASGKMIRVVESEAIQTFYALTKTSDKAPTLPDSTRDYFVSLDPAKITFQMLTEWFTSRVTVENKNKVIEAKYNPLSKIVIKANTFPMVKTDTETTLGRLIYNKIVLEASGMIAATGYVNDTITDGAHGKLIEVPIATALMADKVTVKQMFSYINRRDWLGLQLHGGITPSFTPDTLKIPKEVEALKKELMTKYKKEIENNDPKVSELIENALVSKTMEVLKGDPGLDLYLSGARGSMGNNFKNMNLFRGAVKNEARGGFNVLSASLMDGLEKKDMAAHSNTILGGAYPKAVNNTCSFKTVLIAGTFYRNIDTF